MVRFLHWFANSPREGGTAIIDTHFVLLVNDFGSFELLDSSGKEVKNGELLEAARFYDAGLSFSLQKGAYPLTYNPETKTLAGTFHPSHIPYKLVKNGLIFWLVDKETGTYEKDPTVTASLATALSAVNLDDVPDGEYQLSLDSQTGKFAGFGDSHTAAK